MLTNFVRVGFAEMSRLDSCEIKLLRKDVKNGLEFNEAIKRLHQHNFTIMGSIKFLINNDPQPSSRGEPARQYSVFSSIGARI